MEHVFLAASEVPTGIPTGLPGQPVVENALRQIGSADSLYAPLFIAALAVIALLCWLLYRSGEAKGALMERVVVVAEGYKSTISTITTALDGMKGAQAAMSEAVHDLAREAEGEAREGRHGLAQISQIVTHNAELIRRLMDRIERIADRGRE
jgi:hypothetical protein